MIGARSIQLVVLIWGNKLWIWTPEEATQNLNAMHQKGSLPWNVSFSFARALQEPCMKVWLGKEENIHVAQENFLKRARLNSLASIGQYENRLENVP